MRKICTVIPTYNEAENILNLLNFIERIGITAIVVDDNSPDGTGELVRKNSSAVLLTRRERGLGGALKYGMTRALEYGCEKIITMDADGSHDPAYIKDMIERECDLVIGSRYVKGGRIEDWPLIRRVISSGANGVARAILFTGVKDNTSNYRVYSQAAVRSALKCEGASGYEFQICSLYSVKKARLSICEYPIIFRNRDKGKSKLGSSQIIKWFLYVLGLRLGLN